jgi:hypothetical protein
MLVNDRVETADIDSIIEGLELGWFHWQMFMVCGMAFMVKTFTSIVPEIDY